ncbi:hypothetical protein L6164_010787 [Bauhinia variegata]|uniref:Uncharacterized protein n=1 Tax=Bauhinia variegata TaxID=167791 RepID=A0ACB9P3E4_BAUVA|nr:hypothetical protein L6164_010787 [Bauhinia variegata]
MTMVPAHNLSKQEQQDQPKKQKHDGSGYGGGYETETTESISGSGIVINRFEGYNWSEYCLGSGFGVSHHSHMAEEESTSNSFNEAAGSSASKVEEGQQDNKEKPWLSLQLSIGCQTASPSISTDHHGNHDRDPTLLLPPPTASASSSRLVELDLSPAGTGAAHSLSLSPLVSGKLPETRGGSPRTFLCYPASTSASGASIFQQQTTISGPSFAQNQEINWAFGPVHHTMGLMHSSSSLRPHLPLGSYFPRPLQFPAAFDVAGPSSSSSDIRVVDPPRRPHSGIWFMLQASHNQAKDPFLPQIPKSYLRIKDGRMTIRLLMKYLVNKLKLDSESEIEITCRGQQLLPFLTLQHVRDNIWTSGHGDRAMTLFSESSSTTNLNHIMVLQYGRRSA